MSTNQVYLAVGEEAARGTPESTTIGFIPLSDATLPAFEPDDQRIAEFRGEQSCLGDISFRRMSTKWSYTLNMPLFTEAGTTKGIVSTLFKHFFGYGTSTQNASTGQYYQMLYPVADPFGATANYIGGKAITLNFNHSEGATTKNHAYYGGRVTGVTIKQDPGQLAMVSFAMVGQGKSASDTAIATPAFAAENLRCDYADLTMYYGTITRTGTGPNFTAFTFGSATAMKPDSYTLTMENGFEDKLRLGGVLYPDRTTQGKYKANLSVTIDFDDPSSGFSPVDERNAILSAVSSNNFFIYYNTGTQAGTGDNHSVYVDLPVMQRKVSDPSFSLDRDPMITLNYEGDYDATTAKYIAGMMIKNTASSI